MKMNEVVSYSKAMYVISMQISVYPPCWKHCCLTVQHLQIRLGADRLGLKPVPSEKKCFRQTGEGQICATDRNLSMDLYTEGG